jgi:hypothetical protein
MSDTTVVFLFIPGLFLTMLLFLEVGRRFAMRRMGEETERQRSGLVTVETAIYALLGLLVAFTFSGAASRFEARRVLVVQEANVIGTAYLRLDLLPAAAQPALREKFRLYTEARIAAYRVLPDLEAAKAQMALATALQQEIWTSAVTALREASPNASLLLLPALNDMIDITTTRLVAAKTHTPPVILGALALLALFCSVLAGYGLAGGKPFNMVFHMVGFALVLTLTIYVILDLDHPRVGLIRVDFADQALTDVLAGISNSSFGIQP